jgi:YD repeat-containing protein
MPITTNCLERKYDDKKNLIKIIYPSGNIHEFKYDKDNKLKKIYINNKIIFEIL